MPAFGFSVGDFIAAIELCNKIAKALKDTDGASSDFTNVAIELHGLENVLRRVVALEPTASNIEYVDAIRSLALSCQIPVQEFLIKLQAYESALGPVPTRKFQAGRKLQWAFQMVEEVNKMRDLIATRTASINMSLNMHASEALSRLEAQASRHDDVLVESEYQQPALRPMSDETEGARDELVDQITGATTQLQEGLEEVARESSDTKLGLFSLTTAFTSFQTSFTSLQNVCFDMLLILQRLPGDLINMLRDIQTSNAQMYALLLSIANSIPASPSWLIATNIIFEDALGLKLELPYEYFKHWDIFQSMLRCTFKDRPGERHVRGGRYLILNSRVAGETISKDDWNTVVQPGAHISMSIGLVRRYNKSANCPRPGCMGEAVPVQHQLQNGHSTLSCKQCGMQSTYMSKPTQTPNFLRPFPDPSKPLEESPTPLPRCTVPFAPDANKSDKNPTPSSKQSSYVPEHEQIGQKRTVEQRRHLAQRNIAILVAATKGTLCFLRMITRLRKREEEEFRAFKKVHMKTLETTSMRPLNGEPSSSVQVPRDRRDSRPQEPVELQTTLAFQYDLRDTYLVTGSHEPKFENENLLPNKGRCPNCGHCHKFSGVLQAAQDPSKANYVRCMSCLQKWAPYGGGESRDDLSCSCRDCVRSVHGSMFNIPEMVGRSGDCVSSVSGSMFNIPEMVGRSSDNSPDLSFILTTSRNSSEVSLRSRAPSAESDNTVEEQSSYLAQVVEDPVPQGESRPSRSRKLLSWFTNRGRNNRNAQVRAHRV